LAARGVPPISIVRDTSTAGCAACAGGGFGCATCAAFGGGGGAAFGTCAGAAFAAGPPGFDPDPLPSLGGFE
jgi:hypothetical protein